MKRTLSAVAAGLANAALVAAVIFVVALVGKPAGACPLVLAAGEATLGLLCGSFIVEGLARKA